MWRFFKEKTVLQREAHEKEAAVHQSENWTAGICGIVPTRRRARSCCFAPSGASALNEAWDGGRVGGRSR